MVMTMRLIMGASFRLGSLLEPTLARKAVLAQPLPVEQELHGLGHGHAARQPGVARSRDGRVLSRPGVVAVWCLQGPLEVADGNQAPERAVIRCPDRDHLARVA